MNTVLIIVGIVLVIVTIVAVVIMTTSSSTPSEAPATKTTPSGSPATKSTSPAPSPAPAPVKEGPPPPPPMPPKPMVKNIQLIQTNADVPLNLAEVEVYDRSGSIINLSQNATLTQSSLIDSTNPSLYPVSNLIDGNSGNFAHTNDKVTRGATQGDPQPTFTITFKQPTDIGKIMIFNRTDCCQDRAKTVKVQVEFTGNVISALMLGDQKMQYVLNVDANGNLSK